MIGVTSENDGDSTRGIGILDLSNKFVAGEIKGCGE